MTYTLKASPGKGLQAYYSGTEPMADNSHARIHVKLLTSRVKQECLLKMRLGRYMMAHSDGVG
jgi:hypothetical protein